MAVGWYDTRNAADNKSAEYFAAVSVNGGTSFLPNVALSAGPSNVTGPGGGPRVRVYDGATFEVVEDFFAFEPTFTGGVNVASGDVGQTGFDDIIVGAGAGGGPRVRVFRSEDMAVTRDFFAYDPSFRGGVNVATGTFPGGAFSGGTEEIDPLDTFPAILTAAGPGGGPHVKVFADDLKVQSSFFAFDPTFTGGVRVASVAVRSLEDSEAIVAATGPGPDSRVALLTPTGSRAKPDLVPFAADFRGGVFVGTPDETGFTR